MVVVAHAHFQQIGIIFDLSEIMSEKIGSIFLFQKVLDVHVYLTKS